MWERISESPASERDVRQWTDEGMEEPADYEEQTRVTHAEGAKITFQP